MTQSTHPLPPVIPEALGGPAPPPRGNRTVARAWRGRGAGYRHFLAWGGAGVARAFPVPPGLKAPGARAHRRCGTGHAPEGNGSRLRPDRPLQGNARRRTLPASPPPPPLSTLVFTSFRPYYLPARDRRGEHNYVFI
eukprot:gene16950-biopygen23310